MSQRDDQIEFYRLVYESTGNPLAVWHALALCDPAQPLPAWVGEYLADGAAKMAALCERREGAVGLRASPERLAELALVELGLRRHGWNAFSDWSISWENTLAAYAVAMGLKAERVDRAFATRRNVTPEAARKGRRRMRKVGQHANG